MNYGSFLIQLFAAGDVVLPPLGPLVAEELAEGDAVLVEHEAIWRMDQPAQAPRFDLTAGRWGAVRLFRACQFALYRDADAQAIDEELADFYPGAVTAEVCYSVDLTLRYLPKLVSFARTASAHDPLVQRLQIWASQWPLSSVGMGELNIDNLAIEPLLEHAALRRQYADRIIAAGDLTRLGDRRMDAEIQDMLGMYPELAPRIAAKISSLTVTTP